MKVAYILPQDPRLMGYSEEDFIKTHFSVEIANIMSRYIDKVTLHVFGGKKETINVNDVEIAFYPTSKRRFFSPMNRQISWELSNKEFSKDTVIHFHEPSTLFFDFFMYKAKNPVVTHHHGVGLYPSFYAYHVLNHVIKPIFLKKCKAHIVLNESARHSFKKLGVNEKTIYKVGNGINHEKFKRYPKNFAKEVLSLDPHKKLFLFVGRVDRDKGIRELVTAYEKLKQEEKFVDLKIVGPLHDKNLHVLVKSYLVNFVHPDKISMWYSAADFFVLPSYYEGFGLVLLEALYFDLPVISTDVDVSRELGKTIPIILCKRKDVDSLFRGMRDVLKQNPKNETNKFIKENYSWDKICKKYIEIYEKALE